MPRMSIRMCRPVCLSMRQLRMTASHVDGVCMGQRNALLAVHARCSYTEHVPVQLLSWPCCVVQCASCGKLTSSCRTQ